MGYPGGSSKIGDQQDSSDLKTVKSLGTQSLFETIATRSSYQVRYPKDSLTIADGRDKLEGQPDSMQVHRGNENYLQIFDSHSSVRRNFRVTGPAF